MDPNEIERHRQDIREDLNANHRDFMRLRELQRILDRIEEEGLHDA